VYPVKVSKQYSYIPGLLSEIVRNREYRDDTLDAKVPIPPEDPRHLQRTIAQTPQPPKQTLIDNYLTRRGFNIQ